MYNAGREGFPEGRRKDIAGFAYVPDVTKPGNLKVVLEGVPVEGDCKFLTIFKMKLVAIKFVVKSSKKLLCKWGVADRTGFL